jgi:Legionella pneumophila major outer membrane protein precursor
LIRWLLFIPIICHALSNDMVQITGHAEAIYWKPTTGGFDLSVRESQVDMVKPDGHWGVRGAVGILAPWSCTGLTVGGLFIQTDDSHRVVGDIDAVAFGVEGGDEVVGRLRFKYWNIDAVADYTPFPGPCLNMAILAGARYVEINQKQNVRSLDDASVKYRYRGIGPGLGVGGSWCVWQGLQLSAQLYAMALIGTRATALQEPEIRTHYPNATTIVPAADLSILISYSLDWSGFLATFGIGYDLQHYWQVTNEIPPFGVDIWQLRSPHTVGFGGPSVRVGVRW